MTEIRKVNFNLQKWAYKTKNRCLQNTKVKFTEFWYNKTTTKEKKTTVESKKNWNKYSLTQRCLLKPR